MIPMHDKLITWMIEELKKRGWSHRELARRSGMSQPAISGTLSGDRNPGADFCIKIAQALGEPPEKLLRLAGILPPLPASENDPLIKEITDMIKNLPPEKREEIARFVKFLYQEHKEAE